MFTPKKQTIQILVDSDSCPTAIRSVILKACRKHNLSAVFAADRALPDVNIAIAEHTRDLREEFRQSSGSATPEEVKAVRSTIAMDIVSTGENSADDHLVEICRTGSLAVTRDILLAFRLIEKGALVLTDRGQVFDAANIRQRLSEKEINSSFREAGMFDTEQNKPLTPRDFRLFSNAFNAALQKMLS